MKVAIIANANARAVDKSTIHTLKEAIAGRDEKLFVSETFKDAQRIIKTIVASGYEVILCAGGDGTFSQIITEVMALEPANPPAFGVLRLGTGNGIAEALRVADFSKENVLRELERAHNPEARIEKTLLKIGDRYAPFAGMGLDGYVLDDYQLIKRLFDLVPLLPQKNRGIMDYAVAIASISFWRYAFAPQPNVLIKCTKGKAYRIDFSGNRIGKPIMPGDIIFKGKASFTGASTVPYYGFNIPLFPQVISLFNRFQLMVSAMEAYEVFLALEDIVKGRLSHPKVWNFGCQEITIEILDAPKKGIPAQIGGDSAGRPKKMKISVEKINAVSGSAAAAGDPPTK